MVLSTRRERAQYRANEKKMPEKLYTPNKINFIASFFGYFLGNEFRSALFCVIRLTLVKPLLLACAFVKLR